MYTICVQQPAGFRHFTEVCEVDSPVSRRCAYHSPQKSSNIRALYHLGSISCHQRHFMTDQLLDITGRFSGIFANLAAVKTSEIGLFTTSSDAPVGGERFFQVTRRRVPSFSAKFHPSVQNRSALRLIYHKAITERATILNDLSIRRNRHTVGYFCLSRLSINRRDTRKWSRCDW